jgi:hypothetical protein
LVLWLAFEDAFGEGTEKRPSGRKEGREPTVRVRQQLCHGEGCPHCVFAEGVEAPLQLMVQGAPRDPQAWDVQSEVVDVRLDTV